MTKFKNALGGIALMTATLSMAAPMALANGNDDHTEAQDYLAAGMSLTQAVAKAETSGGGKAMSAAWEPGQKGAMAFEVELAKADGTVRTVRVDPKSGAVTSVAVKSDEHHDGDWENEEDKDD